ncbi:hydroxymethylbilane synthase [Desulfosalsimonas propionicica]|uniref:Porphobilinogen deaminase n=1 Tax=Desulfosalsimonas propionicica TaxID=332175 RepID=A0A7W0HJG2_9BACT|nr:hydroxymethylbilane synthase [Desulfosalsimonas propionicica]MBA2880142.1 hydroxymethylbilane synthase [Desulfosalsimonas propionicica]
MTSGTIRIGTRGSQLALWQANWVKHQIQAHHPEISVELAVIKTSGDKILDVPLAKVGGKGLFVKEIEEALLAEDIHMAVHSMKDMPGEIPEGLCIAAIPVRENPCDALIARNVTKIEDLPQGASIGTSSLRRGSQMLYLRPDLDIRPLRGNIDTRIKKLESENLDAVILAAAGMMRLGFGDQITAKIDPQTLMPAVGQGALCIEARKNDAETADLLSAIHHPDTACTVLAERAFLKRLQGGCQVPIAAFAQKQGRQLTINAMVAEIDGSVMYREQMQGTADDPEKLGTAVAGRLIDRGAGDIVQRLIEEARQT